MSVLSQVIRDVKQRDADQQAALSSQAQPVGNPSPLVSTPKPGPAYRKWLLLVIISLVLGAAGAWVANLWRAEPELQPEPMPQPAMVVVESELEPVPVPEPEPEPVIQPEPQPAVKPESVAAKPEPEPEPAEPKPTVVEPVAKPQTKPAAKPQAKPAEKQLQVVIEPPSAEELALEALGQGQAALRRGQLSQAEQFLLKALEHQPRWVLAHQVLAQVYATGQRYDDALSQLADLAPPVRQHLDFYQLRGALAQQLQAYELAKRSYEALLGVDASQGRWWLGMGLACDGMGARQQALQAYGHALASRQLSAASEQYAQQRLELLQ